MANLPNTAHCVPTAHNMVLSDFTYITKYKLYNIVVILSLVYLIICVHSHADTFVSVFSRSFLEKIEINH